MRSLSASILDSHNHYISIVGYEDTPPHSTLAYSQQDVHTFTTAHLPHPTIAGNIYTPNPPVPLPSPPTDAHSSGTPLTNSSTTVSNTSIPSIPCTSATMETADQDTTHTEPPQPPETESHSNDQSQSETVEGEPLPIRTTIILADTSRTNSTLLSAKWEDIANDIESLPPNHFNIRRPWMGMYERKTKRKGGGNIHCLMKFSKA